MKPSLSTRWWPLLVLACLAAACSEIAHTNPYDPGTPSAQQATGTITGALAVPADFALSIVKSGTLRLRLAGETASEDLAVTAPTEAGTFLFEAVAAGTYEVLIDVPGFRALVRTVLLDVGASYDLGTLTLEALTGPGLGAIVGVARRADGTDDGHGGILVQARDTPYTAATGGGAPFGWTCRRAPTT